MPIRPVTQHLFPRGSPPSRSSLRAESDLVCAATTCWASYGGTALRPQLPTCLVPLQSIHTVPYLKFSWLYPLSLYPPCSCASYILVQILTTPSLRLSPATSRLLSWSLLASVQASSSTVDLSQPGEISEGDLLVPSWVEPSRSPHTYKLAVFIFIFPLLFSFCATDSILKEQLTLASPERS